MLSVSSSRILIWTGNENSFGLERLRAWIFTSTAPPDKSSTVTTTGTIQLSARM